MFQRKQLGDILLENGLLSELQLKEALAEQRSIGEKLVQILVRRGFINEQKLIEILEFSLGIPQIKLDQVKVDPAVVRILPTNLIHLHQILPIAVNQQRLTLGMVDPLNYEVIDNVRILTGLDVLPVLVSENDMNSAIRQFAALQVDSKIEKLLREMNQYNCRGVEEDIYSSTDEAPIIHMVNSILQQAVQVAASDVHIEPLEQDVRVRFRLDGELVEVLRLPKKSFAAIVSRIKIMGNLDISEKRIPQDGRTRLVIDGREIDFRISSLPSIHGEKMVLRILDRTHALMSLKDLGFSTANLEKIAALIRRPHGMIVVTGPTGSGKTTTLYSILTEINVVESNIVTLEDPVEYSLMGINQVQINNKAGLTFPVGLRSILRQDPDIIMVGEMRDNETTELGVRAALTGHLFFSTLHTNSASGTVARMVNMGVENYLLSSSLIGVVSQRLIRQLCPYCKQPYQLDEIVARRLGIQSYVDQVFYRSQGCNRCHQAGYSGRMALHEVLVLGPKMRMAINGQVTSEDELEDIARQEGMITMREDGIEKALTGSTSLEEVMKGVFLGG